MCGLIFESLEYWKCGREECLHFDVEAASVIYPTTVADLDSSEKEEDYISDAE